MSDRVALITGATSGVGRVVAERLGRQGWQVLVHGRDRARAEQVVSAIQGSGGAARFQEADLSSMRGVRQLAEDVMKEHPSLQLLINNAGVGFGRPGAQRERSQDGFELRFAVNYLAPFLLTHRLIPALLAGAPSRVVNVASIGQQELDFDNLQMTHGYSGVDAYRRSKLALIMFTFDLAAELQGRTGEYFDQQRPARALRQAYDPKVRERLRQITNELTRRESG